MTLPPVIGISGRKRAGKSTLAKHFVAGFGYQQKSFAEPLKRMALAIDPIVDVDAGFRGEFWTAKGITLSEIVDHFGWEQAKDRYPEVRRFLQRLGTDGVRDIIGADTWVDLAGPWPQEGVVFADVRFDNEAERIIRYGGVVIEVSRKPMFGPEADVHASEQGVDLSLLRGVVVNDSTPAEMYRQALALLES